MRLEHYLKFVEIFDFNLINTVRGEVYCNLKNSLGVFPVRFRIRSGVPYFKRN